VTTVVAWEELLEGEELAHLETEPAREATLAPFPNELERRVRATLEHDALYAHQREVWDAVARGDHVIVTTGTASGKSLAFNLPVLDALVREPKNRALYLYPTKALAQDQARALQALKLPKVRAAIYDGDTELERRWQIRKWSNLILSNPDMLHVGVLPHHDRWGDFLANLRYVVVDEAHVYRGVFGSHVANVLRRGAARGADDRALEPAARRRGAAAACERARRGFAAPRQPNVTRPAHDLLRQEPQGGRARAPVRARARRRRGGEAARAVPRRLHARTAP
jgi:DEAD/DEAH box helicase domain-containing protein